MLYQLKSFEVMSTLSDIHQFASITHPARLSRPMLNIITTRRLLRKQFSNILTNIILVEFIISSPCSLLPRWTIKESLRKRIETFEMWTCRRILYHQRSLGLRFETFLCVSEVTASLTTNLVEIFLWNLFVSVTLMTLTANSTSLLRSSWHILKWNWKNTLNFTTQ